MANPDAAFGFRPVNNDLGAYTGLTRRCIWSTSNSATAAFIGDCVKQDADTGGTTQAYQVVVHATIASPIYGVITSFEANPDNLSQQYRPGAQLRYCQVALAEGNLFEGQASTALGVAVIGNNALLATGTGSTYTGLSKQELGTATTADTGDFQVIQGVDRADNDLTLDNANWIVKFNKPQSAPDRTGT